MTFKSKLPSALIFPCLLLISSGSWAQKGAESSGPLDLAVVAPVVDCATLASADISAAVGSPTHITSATPVSEGKPAPYCEVKGYVDPQVKFEVRLPLTTWTQRLVQTGCGGLCGMLSIHLGNDQGCLPAQNGELALTSTDMGHSGGMDGKFGEKDYQLRIDFAYRGVHVTTLGAKALIEKYYGQKPKYSYFTGCSDGGREALMEAQRYPEDFNGITAGAPAMNFVTQNTFYHGWNARTNTGVDGQPILTADKLPILHHAVVAKCDAEDGLKDGLISNPIGCQFDPEVVACKPGQDTASCLTPAQVKVARDIYAGAHDSNGDKLVLSGPLPGSELAWAGVYIPAPGSDRTMSLMISTGTLKYLAYEKNPPADYSLADLKFNRSSFIETTKLHALYDSTDPDLSPFALAGGKLILWHGLADPHISPLNTIAYYTAVQQTMAEAAADKFLRLYLFPGGYHCAGGEGPFTVDLLSAIMAWVERGTAPNALLASHTPGNGAGPGGPPPGVPPGLPPGARPGMGLPPAEPPPNMAPGPPPDMERPETRTADRTRPVYPYPFTASYTGSGSSDDAKNFTEGKPEPIPATKLVWLGSSFYTPHYEEWCSANRTTMSCKPSR
jgi:Tannase and feruloyl esterase